MKIPGFRGVLRDDAPARSVYSEAAGIGQALPRAVAVPRDADDVATLLRWASAERVPVIARGSGSSMPGGAIGDGIVLDMSRLESLGAVDPGTRAVVAEPGVVCAEVDAAARAVGLRFPVDPSSAAFCTIGGMIATNAAGAHTFRHGAMRRWVRALDCVFADGTRATVTRGRSLPTGIPALERFGALAPRIVAGERTVPSTRDVRKNSSGYATAAFAASGELVDLLVGSEGTLAITVRADLALAPLPRATASLLAAFASIESAVIATQAARELGASACELLDRTFLEVAATAGPLPIAASSESALMIEVEGHDPAECTAAIREIAARCEQAGATAVILALSPTDEERLWELRHAASPILARLDPSLKSMQFIEDGVVPPARLPEYVRGVRAALDRQGIRGVIFGHAGDAHVHVNPLVDVRLPDWRARVAQILDDVSTLAASLGGTLAGEHGDGRLRTPLLDRIWPAEVRERWRLVKDAFDPFGVLNPGVKVPTAGERPLNDIKYDPTLAPLPAAARRALDTVERERAYSRFRLTLLDG